MNRLKKQVKSNFLLFSIVMVLLISIADSIFDEWLLPMTESNQSLFSAILFMRMMTEVCIWGGVAWLFMRRIGKKFKKEVERQINERNVLYAEIVHDIKTPITSILGFAQAIRDGKGTAENRADMIDTIYSKAKQTDDLINILFGYSKIMTNEYQFHFENVDACRLVREAVAADFAMLEEKGIDLKLNIPTQPILLSLDKVEFRRAISNVIGNAWKHNPHGSKVCVDIQEENKEVVISIADNGVKIAEEYRERIFKPFEQGEKCQGSFGGSGLGLAIATKIFEQHGGSMEIQKGDGDYTKAFIIRLMG